MRRPQGLALLTSVGVLALTTSCTRSVEVTPPDPGADAPPAEVLEACADLATELPDELAGQPSRPTTPESALTAAWGDPAVIIVRCGVPRPETLTASSQLVTVDGVDWFAEELTAGYLFTATGRTAYVEVTVPDDYAPEIGPVTELSPLVATAIPERTTASESP